MKAIKALYNEAEKKNKIPSLGQIIKENPPIDEEPDLDYLDEDEEEELDLASPLLPFEEKYYDDEGDFYPNGYYDDEGNIIPNAKMEEND